MTIKENTVIYPLPDTRLIEKCEKHWRLTLPEDFRQFISCCSGAVPNEISFDSGGRSRAVERFLCILENYKDTDFGWYDIRVVESQIGERLTDNEDLLGMEVLPIAALFAGDYACLDFRADKENPSVCVWSHEESEEFAPVTYKVADSFTDFLSKLR